MAVHVLSDDDRHGRCDFDAFDIDDVDFIEAISLAEFGEIRPCGNFVGTALIDDFQCVGHQKVVEIVIEGDNKVLLGGLQKLLRLAGGVFAAHAPDDGDGDQIEDAQADDESMGEGGAHISETILRR